MTILQRYPFNWFSFWNQTLFNRLMRILTYFRPETWMCCISDMVPWIGTILITDNKNMTILGDNRLHVNKLCIFLILVDWYILKQDNDVEMCCICFDQACTIEVRQCGHQMCAHCMLAMCCHKKPNPATSSTAAAPVCPFCRSSITQLVVAKSNAITHNSTEMEASPSRPRRPRKAVNLSEGSSSFKGLTAIGSFGKIGSRNSGRIAAECSEGNCKP